LEEGAHQRGLACAEVAFEVNHGRHGSLFNQHLSQRRAQRAGHRFIRQGIFTAGIIDGMHDWQSLKDRIRGWGAELGFSAVAFTGIDLGSEEAGLRDWLAAGCHGEMDYMAAHGSKRTHPAELVPGTQAVISCRMDYGQATCRPTGADFLHADISCYALGRDYHKLLRARLQQLAERIESEIGPFGYRALTDSAPVMEVALAERAGLGWRGKHTLLLSQTGSWFFLGELYVALPLPADAPVEAHCGSCTACLDACPTGAFIAPYRLDARRCISYLTIEHRGSIPEELRPLLGRRIYGCDDCQIACPWNRFAPTTREADFLPRHGLDQARLVELFAWSESDFNDRLAGSPIRRIGHERWLRNIAVALGNAASDPVAKSALLARRDDPSALVREHVAWALARYPG
jgi:epoxyqueuosine reductase